MNSKSGPGRLNEKAFAKLVQERLIDTEQVREMVGLTRVQGVHNRVARGVYSGPVISRGQGVMALWDRVTVEREEAARIKAAQASGDGRSLRTVPA